MLNYLTLRMLLGLLLGALWAVILVGIVMHTVSVVRFLRRRWSQR